MKFMAFAHQACDASPGPPCCKYKAPAAQRVRGPSLIGYTRFCGPAEVFPTGSSFRAWRILVTEPNHIPPIVLPLPLLDRVRPLVSSVISCLWPLALSLSMLFSMLDVRRLLEAAGALSSALRANGVPHAFYGNLFTALLSNTAQAEVRSFPPFASVKVPTHSTTCSQEIFCIVEFGQTSHPFRRVRQAVQGRQYLSTTASPWSNRCVWGRISSWP